MLRLTVVFVLVAGCGKDKEVAGGAPASASKGSAAAPAAAPGAGSAAKAGCDLLTQQDLETLGKQVEKATPGDKGKRCTFKLAGTSGTISIMTTGHKSNHEAGRQMAPAEPVPGLGIDAFYQSKMGALLSVAVAERSSFFVQSTESEKENPKRKEELIELAKVAIARLEGRTPAPITAVQAAKPRIDKIDVCGLLQPADFEAAKLTASAGKAEEMPWGNACTWDRIHGKGGGFLHVEQVKTEDYDAKKAAATPDQITTITGAGDEAIVIKSKVGTNVLLKKGDKRLRFSGTMMMKPEHVEPLARTIAGKL